MKILVLVEWSYEPLPPYVDYCMSTLLHSLLNTHHFFIQTLRATPNHITKVSIPLSQVTESGTSTFEAVWNVGHWNERTERHCNNHQQGKRRGPSSSTPFGVGLYLTYLSLYVLCQLSDGETIKKKNYMQVWMLPHVLLTCTLTWFSSFMSQMLSLT